MWKRLLVPHDFSTCAARALDVAAALAEGRAAVITLLHVSPLPPNLRHDAKIAVHGNPMPVQVDELLTTGGLRDLGAIAAPLQARGLSVQTLARATEPGSPAAAILRVADELNADVIVMGTHGRTGLRHLLLGSVAENVIRGSRVPVVTIRASDEEAHPTREETLAEDELQG